MTIRRKEGIRDYVKDSEVILYNTYTYERLKLTGAAVKLWNDISDKKNLDFDMNELVPDLREKIENIVGKLACKGYIEVTE